MASSIAPQRLLTPAKIRQPDRQVVEDPSDQPLVSLCSLSVARARTKPIERGLREIGRPLSQLQRHRRHGIRERQNRPYVAGRFPDAIQPLQWTAVAMDDEVLASPNHRLKCRTPMVLERPQNGTVGILTARPHLEQQGLSNHVR